MKKGLFLKTAWLMAFVLLLLPAMADPAGEAYGMHQYTITISAGRQGLISGAESVTYGNLNYGDRVNFNLRDVTLHDGSKYYVKGIRPAGRDNSDSYRVSSFVVEKDMDYVIAYGLLTDAVAYTVEYVDTEGNELAPTETYYGNVGDKPVVAFLYIEGYRPNAYNITQTLKADPAENVFTFVYTKIDGADTIYEPDQTPGPNPEAGPDGPVTTTTIVRPAEGTGDRPNVNPGGIPVVPAEEQGGGGQGGQGAGNGQDDGGGDEGGEEIPDLQTPLDGPEELVDIDEPETPLTSVVKVIGEAKLLGIPVWLEILLALAIAAGCYTIYKRRRDA